MNLLVLGGNSQRHHTWIREIGASLEAEGHKVTLHDYTHWSTGDEAANVDLEVKAIEQLMSDRTDYAVVAKSIGTVIAAVAIERGALRPSQCVLLGVPLNSLGKHLPDVHHEFSALPQTTFIQNEHDPLGSAQDVRAYVEQSPPSRMQFVTTPGDTHDYRDFALIARALGSSA